MSITAYNFRECFHALHSGTNSIDYFLAASDAASIVKSEGNTAKLKVTSDDQLDDQLDDVLEKTFFPECSIQEVET